MMIGVMGPRARRRFEKGRCWIDGKGYKLGASSPGDVLLRSSMGTELSRRRFVHLGDCRSIIRGARVIF